MNPFCGMVVTGEKRMSIWPDLPPIVLLAEVTENLLRVVIGEKENVLPVPSWKEEVETQPTL